MVAIQENPLATIDQLALRTGASKPTIVKRLRSLEGSSPREIASDNPEEGRYFTITPVVNNASLGLEFVSLFLETKNSKDASRIEKIIDDHPYPQYRARCYGKNNGILLQFRIPHGTKPLIVELMDRFLENNLANNAIYLPGEENPPVYSTLRIEGWNSRKMGWEFDWDRWFQKNPKPNKQGNVGKRRKKAVDWLMKNDIHVIQEVMFGARRKNKEIMQSLDRKGISITPQTFSRRYKMIKKDCFDGYKTIFDPTIFDIYNNIIITGQGSKKYLSDLRLRLETEPMPFESTMRVSGTNLFWYLRLQASHLSGVMSNLNDKLTDMGINILDYRNTMVYWLWPDAFDDETRSWKTSPKYMVDASIGKGKT